MNKRTSGHKPLWARVIIKGHLTAFLGGLHSREVHAGGKAVVPGTSERLC